MPRQKASRLRNIGRYVLGYTWRVIGYDNPSYVVIVQVYRRTNSNSVTYRFWDKEYFWVDNKQDAVKLRERMREHLIKEGGFSPDDVRVSTEPLYSAERLHVDNMSEAYEKVFDIKWRHGYKNWEFPRG